MIELTTGIALFMSSLTGASVGDADIAKNIQISTQSTSTPVIEEKIDTTSSQILTLEAYLRQYFADTPELYEIAKCESQFIHFDKYGRVLRGMVDSNDVGVMQINERYHLDQAEKLNYDIHTLEGNLAYAKYLYNKSGVSPWSASKPCWGKKVATIRANALVKAQTSASTTVNTAAAVTALKSIN